MLAAVARATARGATVATKPAAWGSFQLLRFSDDTHDDFKPQYKDSPSPVHGMIEKWIKENKVFVFMKGTPDAPMCGFSNTVCRILDAYGVKYSSANVLADPDLREGIKTFTKWPTIPQVFVDGEFVGGSDILLSMHNSGELPKTFGMTDKDGN